MAPNNNETTLTELELKFIRSVFINSTGPIEFNADAVATELGYKSGKVVKDRWSQIRIKHGLGGATKGNPKSKSPLKRSKGSATPAANVDGKEGEEEEEGVTTPMPKKRKTKAQTKDAAEKEDQENSKNEDVKVKNEKVSIKKENPMSEDSDEFV